MKILITWTVGDHNTAQFRTLLGTNKVEKLTEDLLGVSCWSPVNVQASYAKIEAAAVEVIASNLHALLHDQTARTRDVHVADDMLFVTLGWQK